jgi:hypothetical protein
MMSYNGTIFISSLENRFMVVPFIALLAIIILVIYFLAKAGKKKAEGRDLGETGRAG